MLSPFLYLGMFELSYIGIGLVAGPAMGRQRRSHFGMRVLLTTIGLLTALLLVTIQNGALETVAIRIWIALTALALVSAPFVWFRKPDRFPGSSEPDGPGGSGPDRPPPSRPSPIGGVPLPDADQARARVRDHSRQALIDRPSRRPAREPAPAPPQPGRRP